MSDFAGPGVAAINSSIPRRNAFPDVITKGLVSESEARDLWQMCV